MRSSRLVFLGIALSLFAVAAFADSIDSVTPSSFFVNDAEVQITVNGSGLQGNIQSIVNFDGPGGHFIAATDAGASTFLVVSVPPGVLATAGHYLVSVDAMDDTGTRHIDGGALDIINRPAGPPQIFVPESIGANATSPSGAAVLFTVVAINGDGTPAPFTCNGHNSGDTYPIGTTVVTCDATDSLGAILRDSFGNPVAEGTFSIFVSDTVAPVLNLPARIVSTDPVVTYTVTAVDAVDGSVPVTCSPASGSTFPLGNTTVQCSASDTHANVATGSFVVFIGSDPPPSLNLPADFTVSTTRSDGAVVTFTATSDPGVPVDCVPASGTLFPFGTTTVQCTATKSSVSSTTGTFHVTVLSVADLTPPVLTLPSDISAEATSPSGAVVTYTASANDDTDGPVPVTCTPPSGSTFALGTTTVQCTAHDAAGNVANGSFHVNVVDTTPPVVTVPANITADATSLAGAVVTFTATATDIVSGNVATTCTPASGSTFAIGTTTVQCRATDASGNTGSKSFTVTVIDRPPVLTLPADITKEALTFLGSFVTYTASANDAIDGPRPISCSPASGSLFPLGTTTVHCSASDLHGHTANGSFLVHIVDTTAPTVLFTIAAPEVIPPLPNSPMVNAFVIVGALDAVDIIPFSHIVSVTSNQPVTGPGDTTSPDWEITGPLTLRVRAERTNNADRIYTITVSTEDHAGNATISTTTIRIGFIRGHGVGH